MFDFLKKAQDAVATWQKKVETITAKNIQNQPQGRTAKKIIAMFYADYPETPYISPDRKSEWIEQAAMFPKTMPVQRSMMVRFADGLLPGHVYMLYWLKKYTNKKVPVYFEYKYGIDFEQEKVFLYQNGFLDDMNKPTAKGEQAIEEHNAVVQNHSPRPDVSIKGISEQIIAERDDLRRNGFKEYEFIANRDCCPICAALNGKHFPVSGMKLGVNAPPMHEGCRCSIAAYVEDKEYEAWLDFLDHGGTTAEWEATGKAALEKAKKKKK